MPLHSLSGVPTAADARGTIVLPRTKELAIPPVDDEPQLRPDAAADPPAAGAAGDGDRATSTVQTVEVDEAELDAKWGFTASEPLVGFGAPPVVAVLVTADPGDWFEETLESLADQDYENLSVLVLDNGSRQDPTERIADVLPTAFVKRLDADRGFSAAANEVLVSVEGAAFYLILHDDVRLGPGALTALVSEAFRANAGIVGPKLVDWDRPDELRSVGYSVDPYGFASSLSEPGELDQSQHDIAREVFAVSDACMLIRSDLFDSLGGFTESIPYFGEDIDLCWRAHVAAASVNLCPNATVAHRQRFDQRRESENRQRLELRHEARTMLSNYELLRLLRVTPVVLLLSLVDLFGSLVLGRFRRAGDIAASWVWNLTHLPSLWRARSRVKRSRRAHDSAYLPLMRQGSSRLRSLIRAEEGENRLQAVTQASRGYLRDLTSGPSRAGVIGAVVAAVLMLVGARGLISGPLPVLREFIDAGSSGPDLVAQWFAGWRDAGLGEPAVAPAVVPGLGALGTVLFGSIGLARRLLILLPLLLGGIGAWKLFVRTGSTRGRAAALAAYGLNPVVLNAVAEGRLQALVAYGAAPWLLRRLARGAGVEPFAAPDEPRPARPRHLAGTALLLAAVAAVTPLGAAILIVAVLLLALVQLAMGERRALRVVVDLVVSSVAAVPVVLPWLVAAVRHGDLASLTGLWTSTAARPSAAEIITGSLGVVEVGVFGWGVVIAAMYAVVVGRSWRITWAASGWVLAFASWVGTVLLSREDLLGGAGAELFLVPAVLGLAIWVALGAVAFERDVIGSDFGVAQVLSGVAVIALAVGVVPVAVASMNGRWYQPEGDFRNLLSVVDDGQDFRSVWIGDPDVLPLSGWGLGEGHLSMGISSGLDPTITQRYRLDGGAGVASLTEAVDAALDGQTSRLGRLLAPMGVRYIVVVNRPAPQPYSPAEVPMPQRALSSLREQLDLQEIEINPGVALFATTESWPLRSDVTDLGLPGDGLTTLGDQLRTGYAVPPAVLGADPGTSFSGELGGDRSIAQSVTADPGWTLEVDGEDAERTGLFAWAQQFRTPAAGDATLSWNTPWSQRVLQLVQVAGLLVLLAFAVRRRRMVATPSGRRRRSRVQEPVVVVGPEGLLPAETTAETAAEASVDALLDDPAELGGPGDPASVDPEDPLLSGDDPDSDSADPNSADPDSADPDSADPDSADRDSADRDSADDQDRPT
ncbi:MAG: glycosyltransferase family 2 protein [Microthrixaceae bacterium]